VERIYKMRWDARSGKLSLVEELVAALGYPHVLILEKMGDTGIVLYQRGDPRATGKERKVSYPHRALPRLSIGATPAADLGLVHGPYRGWIEEGAIYALPGEMSNA
jgi:hypothetical protein